MVRVVGLALALVLNGLHPAGSVQTPTDAEAIAAIEQQLASAWVHRDQETITSILAPDWSVTDAAGRVLTKEEVIRASFVAMEHRVDTMVIDDVKVRTFGDTAVATGRTRATGTSGGRSGSAVLRFTDVFVRRAGRWQAVASHASAIAP